jgi:hypothetical protein
LCALLKLENSEADWIQMAAIKTNNLKHSSTKKIKMRGKSQKGGEEDPLKVAKGTWAVKKPNQCGKSVPFWLARGCQSEPFEVGDNHTTTVTVPLDASRPLAAHGTRPGRANGSGCSAPAIPVS